MAAGSMWRPRRDPAAPGSACSGGRGGWPSSEDGCELRRLRAGARVSRWRPLCRGAAAGRAPVTEKIRVLLADDHAVLRSGLHALLDMEPDMEVVGEASNGREAVELARSLTPDVIVMDISMPEMDGLAAAKAVHEMGLPGAIVMLTVHAEEAYLFQTLQVGASGYVLKSSADRELMDAIRAA